MVFCAGGLPCACMHCGVACIHVFCVAARGRGFRACVHCTSAFLACLSCMLLHVIAACVHACIARMPSSNTRLPSLHAFLSCCGTSSWHSCRACIAHMCSSHVFLSCRGTCHWTHCGFHGHLCCAVLWHCVGGQQPPPCVVSPMAVMSSSTRPVLFDSLLPCDG